MRDAYLESITKKKEEEQKAKEDQKVVIRKFKSAKKYRNF